MDGPIRKYGVGRHTSPKGYVMIHIANAKGAGVYMPEHRMVMEERLGRPLRKGETVHHKNGVRDDNRPENLELWTKNHTPGQRVADLIVWARQILDEYEPIEDRVT